MKLKEDLSVPIRAAIQEILQRVNKQLHHELRITKDLCLSIDSDIKHVFAKLPITYQSEKKIIDVVKNRITKIVETNYPKMIEGGVEYVDKNAVRKIR